MANNRVLVQFPPSVIEEIDQIAGRGNRTAYLVELAKRDIKRHRQLKALAAAAGAWKDEDHPELANGADAWVREVRREGNERFERIEEERTAE